MSTTDTDAKKQDETAVTTIQPATTTETAVTTTQPVTTTEPAATTSATASATATSTTTTATATTTPADAAAYYQQYYQQYYPQYYQQYYNQQYNQQYDPQYYQQYYQQQQMATNTNTSQTDTNKTTDTNTTNNNTDTIESTNENDNNNNNDNQDTNTENDTSNTKDLIEWTHFDVSEWVQTIENGQFTEYAPRFTKNEIDGKVLYNITLQQLEMGLYINKMMHRLTIYELIQKLKKTPKNSDNNNIININNNIEFNQQTKIKSITELPKAPPMKRKKKKKNKKKVNDNYNSNNDNRRNISAISTAAFLKLSVKHTMQNNKSSSELLMDKMNNKRKLNDINDNNNGIQYKIEWEYKENNNYNDMIIGLKDSVLFKWEYTRNIWKFINKQAFNENNFNMNVAEEICGCDNNKFIWKPKKIGVYYFGCQIANCALSGNMKIKINVVENNNDGNPNKKPKVK